MSTPPVLVSLLVQKQPNRSKHEVLKRRYSSLFFHSNHSKAARAAAGQLRPNAQVVVAIALIIMFINGFNGHVVTREESVVVNAGHGCSNNTNSRLGQVEARHSRGLFWNPEGAGAEVELPLLSVPEPQALAAASPIGGLITASSSTNSTVTNSSTNATARPKVGTAELNLDSSDVVPLYMQHMTVILVVLHLSVFITGLVGNSLVCLSVYRNQSLQTVTNYYIVNLAVADFLVILICLPPTVYWDLNLTWNFGLVSCKLVLYLQSISVSVSVLTLTCISIDRWYAICKPLEFSSTKSRAKNIIALIWIVSMMIASPDAIFLTTKPLYEEEGYVYMDCTYSWPEEYTKIYQLCIVMLLFVFPFILMTISYSQIVNVLWRNETMTESIQHSIQLEGEQHKKKHNIVRLNKAGGSQSRSLNAPVDTRTDNKINIYRENSNLRPYQHGRQFGSPNSSDNSSCIIANDISRGCVVRNSTGLTEKVDIKCTHSYPTKGLYNDTDTARRIKKRPYNNEQNSHPKLEHPVGDIKKVSRDKEDDNLKAYRGDSSGSSCLIDDGALRERKKNITRSTKRCCLGSHYLLSRRVKGDSEIESPWPQPSAPCCSVLNYYEHDYHSQIGRKMRKSLAEGGVGQWHDAAIKSPGRRRCSAVSILIRSREKHNNSNPSCACSCDKKSVRTTSAIDGANGKPDTAGASLDGAPLVKLAFNDKVGHQNEPYIIANSDDNNKNNSSATKNVPFVRCLEAISKTFHETDSLNTRSCMSNSTACEDKHTEPASDPATSLKLASDPPSLGLDIPNTTSSDAGPLAAPPQGCKKSSASALYLASHQSTTGFDSGNQSKCSGRHAEKDLANKIRSVHVEAEERANGMKKTPPSTPCSSVGVAMAAPTLPPPNEKALERSKGRQKGMILVGPSYGPAEGRLSCSLSADNHHQSQASLGDHADKATVVSFHGTHHDDAGKTVGQARQVFQSFVKPPCSRMTPINVIGLLCYNEDYGGSEVQKRDLNGLKASVGVKDPHSENHGQHLSMIETTLRGSEPVAIRDDTKLADRQKQAPEIALNNLDESADGESSTISVGYPNGFHDHSTQNCSSNASFALQDVTLSGLNPLLGNKMLNKRSKTTTILSIKRKSRVCKKVSRESSVSFRISGGNKTKTSATKSLGCVKQSTMILKDDFHFKSILMLTSKPSGISNRLNSLEYCKCSTRFPFKVMQKHDRTTMVVDRLIQNIHHRDKQAINNAKSTRSQVHTCRVNQRHISTAAILRQGSESEEKDEDCLNCEEDSMSQSCTVARSLGRRAKMTNKQHRVPTHKNSNTNMRRKLCNGKLNASDVSLSDSNSVDKQQTKLLSIERENLNRLGCKMRSVKNDQNSDGHLETRSDEISHEEVDADDKLSIKLEQTLVPGQKCSTESNTSSNLIDDVRLTKSTFRSIADQTTTSPHGSLVDIRHNNQNTRFTASSSSSNARFCKLIESRKKAAKMLIVIVIMFGLCYVPIHFLNILRYTIGLPQNDITTIASLVSHWLCYFNSAVNPLIYNLMSGKFRHEFANLFFCRWFRRGAAHVG